MMNREFCSAERQNIFASIDCVSSRVVIILKISVDILLMSGTIAKGSMISSIAKCHILVGSIIFRETHGVHLDFNRVFKKKSLRPCSFGVLPVDAL